MKRQTTTRRTLLTRLGAACAAPSLVAASAAASDEDGAAATSDEPVTDAGETCVTPFQDYDCMLCCCGGDESCPDKCCFCMCM